MDAERSLGGVSKWVQNMDEADTTDQVHNVIESAIANYCADYIGLIPGAVPPGAMPCIVTPSHPTTDPRCSEEWD